MEDWSSKLDPNCKAEYYGSLGCTCVALNAPPAPEATPRGGAPKSRPDLVPPDALLAVGRVLAWAESRPGLDPLRWRKSSARDHLAPAMRHVLSHLTGEHLDKDTGEPHLAHAAARVLYALAQHLRGK